jgi:hypothetical protein
MSILDDFKQKVRHIICCKPLDVDQNEGPPPECQVSIFSQAQQQGQSIAQSTQNVDSMNNTAVIKEEQEEQGEDDWGDDEIEASPYDGRLFVVEANQYDKYKYDESQYNGDEELQKAFEVLVRNYIPSKQVGPTVSEDANLVWNNRFYEHPIWDWNPNQEINISTITQEAR